MKGISSQRSRSAVFRFLGSACRNVSCAAMLMAVWGAGCGISHPQKMFEKAVEDERAGNLVSAQKLYQQALARDPNHIAALEGYGKLLLRLNQRREAARQLRKAAALAPERLDAAVALARLYLDEHDPARAEEVLAPWSGSAQPPAPIALLCADAAALKNDSSAARKILEPLSRSSKRAVSVEARVKLGCLTLGEGKAADAEKIFREALKAEPSNLRALTGLGQALLAGGKTKEASEAFSKAWADGAKPPLAAVGLVLCVLRDGDPGRALKRAGELSAQYPSELNYGILSAELAVAAESPDTLAAMKLPEHSGLIGQYVDGLRHFANQQYYDSYPLLTSVAREWAGYGPAQLFAGRVAWKLNDDVQALECVRRAEACLPQDPELSLLVAGAALAQSQPELALQQLAKLPEGDARVFSMRTEVAFRQGDYAGALAEAQKWTAAQPDSAWALATAADIQHAMGNSGQAGELWKKASESGEGPAQAWAAFRLAGAGQNWEAALQALGKLDGAFDEASLRVIRGRMEIERGQPDEAEAHFDAAIKQDPRNAAARSWLGLWKALKRQVTLAHEQFTKALELNPNDPIALWGEGLIALLDGRPDASREFFEKSLKAQPSFDLARLMLAETLMSQGRTAEAVELLDRIGLPLKDAPAVMDLRGRALILEQKWEPAMECWKAFRAKNPKSAAPYFYIAQIQWLTGRKSDAKQTVEAGLKAAPNDFRLQLARAEILWENGKKEEALLAAGQASRDNRNVDAAMLTGAMHLKDRHYSKASGVFKNLLTLFPDDARLYALLYESQLGLGKKEDAALTLRTGWLRAPEKTALGLQLAAAQEKADNWSEAISTYREVIKIDPRNVRALNQLAWLLAEHEGDLDEAQALAEQAASLAPDHLAVADTLAWILFRKEQYAEARSRFERLSEKAPDNAAISHHLGMALLKTGDSAGAKAALEKTLTLDPQNPRSAEIRETLKKL